MIDQPSPIPAALEKVARSPSLSTEMPAGLSHVKITRLGPDRRLHTLGAVRLDLSNSDMSESASYALMRTPAAAERLAHTEATFKTAGLFHTRAVAVRQFAVAVAAKTAAGAKTLLALAVAHLRRSEGWSR
jgi:hypothetical protein